MAETDGGDIVIRIRGDSSDLEEAVARTQGAISGLESGADDAADVLGDMGAAAKKTNVNLKGMAAQSLPAVAAGISTVNPAAGAMVGLFGQLAAVAGPLAVAVGVVTAAFALYKHETEKAAEAAERAKESIEAFNDAFEEQAVIAGDLRSELRLINGEIDKDGLAHEKRKNRIVAAGDAIVAALDEQIKTQQELVDQATGPTARVSKEQQEEAAKLTTELNRLKQERVDAIEATESQIVAADAIAEFHREAAEATDDFAGAQGKLADSIEEVSSSLQEQLTLLDDYNQSIETGIGGGAPAGIDALVGRINDLTGSEEELLTASEKLKLEQSALDAEFTRGNVSLEQYDTLTGQIAGKQSELEEEQRGVEEAANATEKALKMDNVQAGLEATAELSSKLATALAKDNKKAAMAMHRTSQAAGIANVAISTSVAIMKALGELGPVAGAIAGVAIGATGAAQIAAIASQPAPSAHIGSGMPGSRDPLAPDERMSGGRRILSTEASGPGGVANSMGTQLLNDVNTGRVQSSGQITAVIGRTHLDQELFRSGRRGTSRYARALRTNPHPKPQGGY